MNVARLKVVFGFLLLIALVGLATAIALSKVSEQESYGLMPIIVALASLAGGFSNWAFGHSSQNPTDDTPPHPKPLVEGEESESKR